LTARRARALTARRARALTARRARALTARRARLETGERLFAMNEDQRKKSQIKIINRLAGALAHNKRVLRQKHQQNRHIMQTSIMLFLYIMAMTVMVMAVGDPLDGLLPRA